MHIDFVMCNKGSGKPMKKFGKQKTESSLKSTDTTSWGTVFRTFKSLEARSKQKAKITPKKRLNRSRQELNSAQPGKTRILDIPGFLTNASPEQTGALEFRTRKSTKKLSEISTKNMVLGAISVKEFYLKVIEKGTIDSKN